MSDDVRSFLRSFSLGKVLLPVFIGLGITANQPLWTGNYMNG